jgi:hypothetical protein
MRPAARRCHVPADRPRRLGESCAAGRSTKKAAAPFRESAQVSLVGLEAS